MVIFHSSVSLPEGILCYIMLYHGISPQSTIEFTKLGSKSGNLETSPIHPFHQVASFDAKTSALAEVGMMP